MSSSIPLFKVFIADEAIQRVNEVFQSGMVAQSTVVDQFENQLRTYIGHNNVVTVNSGTAGLTLALRLVAKPFDEILCTPLTCTATNWSVLANMMKIKWVDVDPKTCNMDLDDLESKLSMTTRVILAIHWGGYALDLDRLGKIQAAYIEKYKQPLYIIEDCAHAIGAEYNNRKIGSPINPHSIAVFSTQAIKQLTTIDGGFMVISDDNMYQRARALRWFGIDRSKRNNASDFRMESDINEFGYKFNMNDVNAAVGLANLPYIDQHINHVRTIAEYYNQQLSNMHGVKLLEFPTNVRPSYWIYSIRIVNKHNFIPFMKDKGIVCSQVHNRNDIHSCVSAYKSRLPQMDKLEKELVCIPDGWWVTPEQVRYIIECIREWSNRHLIQVSPITQYDISNNYMDILALLSQANHQSIIDYTRERFIKNLEVMHTQGQHIFIAKINIDGEHCIIGTGKLWIETKFFEPVGHIEDIVIDKTYRSIGFGQQLVHTLANIAFQQFTCYKVVLNANPDLESFYTSCDFMRDNDGNNTFSTSPITTCTTLRLVRYK
jgi:dTDP-4-amino-4,6-dideoxygalactose transaminase/predicted GNAT family N-acyltransferase